MYKLKDYMNVIQIKFIIMAIVTINGKVFRGSNLTITNNKMYIDGKEVLEGSNEKTFSISVEGNVDNITADDCGMITVDGNVNTVSTMSGDVKVSGDISNLVKTMSGDVEAQRIIGSIKTMSGDITERG